uniref:Tyrosine--tRNA ligase n=1 Tax=Candidatus Kentrum eta TaxID=2126337 RepID=A0A450V530_9GAMM|nr:MAG: tyrosyl-tRNA synthetase [Candidatus Kentron sp. H]VFJ99786.1 MAG: tyrosyl-tRNA synthetase [Candidatus Kentron sp. H]VFK04118.1 MAG: tyrosyl-tRNA synthetase [Candidatus Kentron sp. H]
MKYGVDVTAPHIHIGHAVNLWMYKELQELGHKVVFLIGDFTTRIGDPTGKNKTRPIVPESEIQKNADAFIKQALMILHDDPNLIDIRRNSEWFNEMPTSKFLSLVSMITHSKLAARDMFRKRLEEGEDVYMHEMLYPLLQGYDSVELRADLAIIGSDQLYNEMIGRFYQEKFGIRPQVILTTKITPGIDGGAKQSKSLDNYIGLGHSPREKFGRIMSMPDDLVVQYFVVYTDVPIEKIDHIWDEQSPRDAKLRLAEEIVSRYHGEDIAREERECFISTFSNKQAPDDAPVVSFDNEHHSAYDVVRNCLPESESNSQVRRLFDQGAIKTNGDIVGLDEEITIPAVLKVGKRRWFRLERR